MAVRRPSSFSADPICDRTATGICDECARLKGQVARLLDLMCAAGIEPPELDPQAPGDPGQIMTTRQVEVGILIARGYSNAQIAEELYLGVNSVKTHIRGLFKTLGVHNRTEAALLFVRTGLATATKVDPALA